MRRLGLNKRSLQRSLAVVLESLKTMRKFIIAVACRSRKYLSASVYSAGLAVSDDLLDAAKCHEFFFNGAG